MSVRIDPPYNHKEAFCLMKYRSRDGLLEEILWNSRDGVTPFCIMSRDGKTEMQHVEWSNDVCAPTHQPKVGDRIFVDVTRELAEPHLRAYIDKCWDSGPFPMREGFKSKEHAFDVLMADRNEPGKPYVLEITEANISQFVKKVVPIHQKVLNKVLESLPDREALQLLHGCIAELTCIDSSLEERWIQAQKAKEYIEKKVGPVHWVGMQCEDGDCEICNEFYEKKLNP